MNINILGHVSYPGTYAIYEDADILTILAQAGGPLPGAQLNKVKLHSKNSTIEIDIEQVLDSGDNTVFDIKPNDTIYINQSKLSLFFSRNLLTSLLQILNITLTLQNMN